MPLTSPIVSGNFLILEIMNEKQIMMDSILPVWQDMIHVLDQEYGPRCDNSRNPHLQNSYLRILIVPNDKILSFARPEMLAENVNDKKSPREIGEILK
jgi:hypothetical protein